MTSMSVRTLRPLGGLRLENVQAVWERGHATKAGAIVGAVVMGAAGVLAGWIGNQIACDEMAACDRHGYVWYGLAIGAGAGAGLGALLGSAIPAWEKRYP